MKSLELMGIVVVASLLLSCKTPPVAAVQDGGMETLIQVQSAGFSPNGDGFRDEMRFFLFAEQADTIRSWKVEMIHEERGPQRVLSGRVNMPESLAWDGTTRSGPAPEGSYTAVLTVEYPTGMTAAPAHTAPFRLDVSPPTLRLSVAPVPFSPDGDGVADEVTISLDVQDPSGIETWDIDVMDPRDHLFTAFSGEGRPEAGILWNGRSKAGELVQSADDYRLVAAVRDTLGNGAQAEEVLPVDVLVLRDGDRLKIVISSITFPPYSADFTKVAPEEAEENARIIKRLAEVLKKYARYRITIQGHAVMVYWNDAARGAAEQNEVLLPLSGRRAELVKSALVELGVSEARLSSEGVGGSRPVVPFSDLEGRWKNRRVEFILTRE